MWGFCRLRGIDDEQMQFDMDFRRFDWLCRQWAAERGIDPDSDSGQGEQLTMADLMAW